MELNPERQALSSCCTATPEKINVDWLKNNPGKLFNTDSLIQERQQMLQNIPVSSCNECWMADNQGISSRHMRQEGFKKTHTNIISSPEYVSIKIGTNCNLTCSYCNRYASTAWLYDVVKNGTYDVGANENRFDVTGSDRIIIKLGQKSIVDGDNYQLLIDEAASYSSINQLVINGGEPFLFNNLLDIVNKFQCPILIFTSLGVDSNRFTRLLSKLPKDRISIAVSAENLNELYEFNRYGNTYTDFLKNVDILEKSSIPFNFYSVISNVTIFGFKDFLNKFQNLLGTNICVSPEYLSTYVIDPESREKILATDYNKWTDEIHKNVKNIPTENLRNQANKFINEFAKRRNLSLDIFPNSFINWLNTPEK